MSPYDGQLVIAAINGPSSTVLSGDTPALEQLHTQLQESDIGARIIPVDYAAHSPRVESIRKLLLDGCEGIAAQASELPFYSAVTGSALEGAKLDGEYWYRNLREPVQFERAIRALLDERRRTFVEVSPHPVVTIGVQETAGEQPVNVICSLRRDQGGPRRFCASLAQAWVSGVPVDWSALYTTGARRVRLPSYAFQRQRYWPELEAGAADLASLGLGEAQHPLLGAAVTPAEGEGLMLTGRISLQSHPWLADHAVMGNVVVPGAALLELALHAGAMTGCEAVSDLTLEAPLILEEQHTIELQLSVGEPDELGARRVSIHSRFRDPGGEDFASKLNWTRNASGVLLPRDRLGFEQAPELAGDSWPPAGAQPLEIDRAYDRLAELGVDYGPVFQGLRAAWRRGSQVFAEVALVEDQRQLASQFALHPALLDSMLHGFAASLLDRESGGQPPAVLLPFSLSDVSVDVRGASSLRVCVTSVGQDTISLVAVDATGRVVIAVRSLAMRAVSEAQLRSAGHGTGDSLFRLDWAVKPVDSRVDSSDWAALGGAAGDILAVVGLDGAAAMDLDGATAVDLDGATAVGKLYANFDELARAVEQGTQAPATVLVCLAPIGSGGSAERPLERAHTTAHETLGLMQSWLADERFAASRLVVITHNAVAARPGEDVELSAAPVWGLVRAAQAEDPGRVVLVDLDGERASCEALPGALATDEPQLAIREGTVSVARLARAGSGTVLEPPAGAVDWRLQVGVEGTLEGLRLAAIETGGDLEPGELRVAVRASGLNFRDVVTALGLVPRRHQGEEMIGSEGAGVVVEVGSAVRDISPGDRVMGLLFDSFATTAVVDRRMIVPIPRGWSFTKAASLSGAFLTAYYALVDLAGLRQNERLLVHAAAGGVGMAAVQLARHLGAEVWATASPGKWQALRGLGLDDAHIASSRDLAFKQRFSSATDGCGVDVVLNSLAREYVDASLDLLPGGGRFIEMGKTDIRDAERVASEHPGVIYRAFDLPEAGPQRIQEMLVEMLELFAAGEIEPLPVRSWDVRRARDAFRFMSQARHVGKIVLTLPAAIEPQGTALITGGSGELGAAVARHLVAEHGMRALVIASRRGLQAPGAEALRSELQALGADVRIAACDVSERKQLAALIESIPAEKPLSLVVHSAGVLDDGMVDSLTPERIDRVFAPKVDAAWHLHELTRDLDLQAFILFSSVAGTFGTAGQANYAAANAFLDALATQRQAEGLSAVSMAWGGWQQRSEMTAGLSEVDLGRVRRAGVGAFSSEEGLELFDAGRIAGEAVVVPVRVGLAALRAQARDGELPALLSDLVHLPARRARSAGGQLEKRLAGVSKAEREHLVLSFVREEVAAVLGHSSAGAIAPECAFKELGFDSLLAVELRNRMNATTGLRLPATLVFDYPSPSALAAHLSSELDGVKVNDAPAISIVRPAEEPVAIVGMSCRYPGGVRCPRDLWELVATGTDAIGAFPTDRGWDLDGLYATEPDSAGKSNTREGGFVYDVGDFDAAFFGISPREALAMDPQQRLLLEASWEALEDAGIDPRSLHGSQTGVFAGVGAIPYGSDASAESANVASFRLTGSLGSVASGRIAYTLGLEGPAMSIDTACSSSLVALHLACGALRSGEASLALAGGVTVMAAADAFVEFSRQRGLALDGRCKSFAATADGAGWGEGVGMLVLERLSDARRLGHRVHALVRGSAVNQDGASNGLTAPNGPAQQRVIRQALANAGLSPEEVDAVEAHGTGTVLGDPIEAQALLATYGQRRDRPLWLGSIKSNIAHTQLAAGAAGVIKMVMALQNEILPRTLHAEKPSHEVDWSTGAVALLKEPMPWPREGRPRRAGVSSFGVSGTNTHVIIEEAPVPEPSLDTSDAIADHPAAPLSSGLVPWPLSARGKDALREHAERLRGFVGAEQGLAISDIGRSLARRSKLEDRAVVIGDSREQLLGGLEALQLQASAPNVITGAADAAKERIAFMFTGQGAQCVGMGRELYAALPPFRRALDELCAELDAQLGHSLLEVVLADEGSPAGALLDQTMFTQAALFAIEVSLCRLLDSWGVKPDFLIGHSIGELSAAYIAGVFSLQDACKLVAARGRLMGELPEGGAMVALQASEQEALESLVECERPVALAAVNGPDAVVLSGDEKAVLELAEEWRQRGRKVKRLRVSHAFHSPRMEEMLERFAEVAASISFQPPGIPLVSNLTGEGIGEELCSAEYWVRHVRETVRFADGVGWLLAQGAGSFLEIGPDGVLTAMATECLRDPRLGVERGAHSVVACMKAGRSETRSLLSALAELWTGGAQVDWSAMLDESGGGWVGLPTYPFQRRRYWLESSPPERHGGGELSIADGLRYEVRWKPIAPPAVPASSGVWLLALPSALRTDEWVVALLALLERCGLRSIKVLCDVPKEDRLEDLRAEYARSLGEAIDGLPQGAEPQGVISLLALQESECEPVSSGLLGTVGLAQACADAAMIQAPLWLLTRAAMSVEPSEAVRAPIQAQTWGLGMTLGLEQPRSWGGLVDLPETLDERVGSLLIKALSGAGGEDQLAIRGSGVLARRIARAPAVALDGDAAWTPPKGTILITGGTGGLGAHVARWLARSGAEHLLLVSRRGADAPAAEGLRTELEGLGAAVTIAACDVADRERLRSLIDSLEGHSALRVVFHTAGVGNHGTIDSLSVVELEQALAAKAQGALHLDELTDGLDLSAFVLFSSIAGIFGSGAQAAYAAANASLDALARSRHERGLAATSVAWGPWDGEGLVSLDGADEALRRHGLVPMAPQLAIEALQQALRCDQAQLVVADIRWDAYAPIFTSMRSRPLIEDLPEVQAALQRAAPDHQETRAHLRERLLESPERKRVDIVLELVRGEVARVMGHASSEAVEPKRAFKELGFDSLMAVELRNRLDVVTGLGLPATLVFDYPSPLALADWLLAEISGEGEPGGAPLEAEIATLERGLATLEDGLDRSMVSARLRALLAGLEGEGRESFNGQQNGVSLAERMQSASDEEIFGLIDRELGSV